MKNRITINELKALIKQETKKILSEDYYDTNTEEKIIANARNFFHDKMKEELYIAATIDVRRDDLEFNLLKTFVDTIKSECDSYIEELKRQDDGGAATEYTS
jgi:hypothetical protein